MIAIPNTEKPKDCWDCFNYNCGHWGTHGYDFAETDCPLIDIVTCGECKWWNEETHGCNRNPSVEAWWETGFCSYGERKGE